jgi:hypothetical protein
MMFFPLLFGKRNQKMPETNRIKADGKNRAVGTDRNGNTVFRCERTKLLYVLGKPQKKYVSVTQIKLDIEKE